MDDFSRPVSIRDETAERGRSPLPRRIRCGEFELRLGRTPRLMGILNVTPDSFSDGGCFLDPDSAVRRAVSMIEAGAHVIDIGGESTRPDADPVSAGEELDRVLPVIDALVSEQAAGAVAVPLSIDTHKAEVAAVALEHGCSMVNDVSAAADPEMAAVLRDYPDVSVVIMHMKGDPKSMQDAPHYENVVREVTAYLAGRARALEEAGISRGRIVVDPGIGFGKRFRDNLELLNRVDSIRALGYPVLIGASRKRFLGELLDAGVEDRLPGSLAVAARCYDRTVEFVRVHDVRETAGMFRVLDALAFPRDYEADW
jgi:dihydropteroate synthase